MAVPALDPIDANFQQAGGACFATSKLGEVREDNDHHLRAEQALPRVSEVSRPLRRRSR